MTTDQDAMYVEGRDLDHVVTTGGPMLVEHAVDCLIQAARGIEAAHALGIIHRDIRPGNLVFDATGTVRVLNPGLANTVDASNPLRENAVAGLTQNGMDTGTVDYMAPEQADESGRVDHRADIYSLGCTLYFLLTSREPFPGETVSKKLVAHREQEAPSLRAARPDVSMALEACYQKMLAKRPEDRPGSMTDVIALLLASKPRPDDVTSEPVPPSKARSENKDEPSINARREERVGLDINDELNLQYLVTDVRPKGSLGPTKPPTIVARLLERTAMPALRGRFRHTGAALLAAATSVLLLAALVGFVVTRRGSAVTPNEGRPPLPSPKVREKTRSARIAPPVPEQKTIFDGKTGRGWMLCNRAPLPPQNIQPDGLNPRQSGSYLVVYDQKLGDFVLDFDYKLTAGCDSGVFLRVSDLNNPVQTGIEVALDATRRGDDRDSGAFYGLVPPTVYTQKPLGQWNHMKITAHGPNLEVSINETEVSSINLDLWTRPGKRPDGSDHRFPDCEVASHARSGYLGFQDLGCDCWFKNIVLNSDGGRTSSKPPSLTGRSSTPAPGQ